MSELKLVDIAQIEKLQAYMHQNTHVNNAPSGFYLCAEGDYIKRADLRALLERSPEASPPVDIEPVAWMLKGKGIVSFGEIGEIPPTLTGVLSNSTITELYTLPPNTIDTSTYDGAREDLAIWKKRALEAEEKVRVYNQRII